MLSGGSLAARSRDRATAQRSVSDMLGPSSVDRGCDGRLLSCHGKRYENTLRDPADRKAPPRELPRRAPELGRPPARVPRLVLLLHRRPPRDHRAVRGRRRSGAACSTRRSTFSPRVSIPAKSTMFIQSEVHEHAELMWLLNTITPLGLLERMTQYKDKKKRHADAINAGLLNYPILMAADILLVQGDHGPRRRRSSPAPRARARARPQVQQPVRRDLPRTRAAAHAGRADHVAHQSREQDEQERQRARASSRSTKNRRASRRSSRKRSPTWGRPASWVPARGTSSRSSA